MMDGLGGEEVQASGIGAGLSAIVNPYWAGSVTGSGVGTFGQLVTGGSIAATGPIVAESKKLSANATGSPSTFGASVQGGAFVFDAGSDAIVQFPTAYASAPVAVVITPLETGSGDFQVVGIAAGSFVAISENASASGSWVAIGTL